MNLITQLVGQFGGWDGLVAMVAPILMSLIYQSHWSTSQKENATWVISLVLGGAVTFFAGGLTGGWVTVGGVVFNFGVILVGATNLHDKFFRPTGIANTIETATTLKKTSPVS